MFVLFCVILVFFSSRIMKAADPIPTQKTTAPALAKVEAPKPAAPKPPKIETISSLKLISIDQQIFMLHEDETSWGVVPAISFAKGERVQRTFPAPVKDWQLWRTRFLQMMTSFPKAKKCPHTVIFQSEQQGEDYKDKEVCLDELSSAQRMQLQQLTKEWSKFLYGS